MQLKQLFHMLRAAAPDEPAPKTAPQSAGGTFAAVLSGTLDADALQDAPRPVRQALHGMIRQVADGERGGPVEGLPDGMTDALRHSLEALLKGTGPDTTTDEPGGETPEADAPAPDAPRLVLKADGTVQLQLPSDRTAPGKDGHPPSAGRAPGDTPRYTQPGGPGAQDPAMPADHRVRHPKAREGTKTGQQPVSSGEGNANDAPAPRAPRPSAGPEAAPDADRPSAPDPTTKPASPPAPKSASAAITAAVAEAIERLAAEGQTAAEGTEAEGTKTEHTATEGAKAHRTAAKQTKASNAAAGEPATGDAARRLQTAAAARTAPAAESKAENSAENNAENAENAPTRSGTLAATASTAFPTEAAPVLYASDGTPADQGDAKTAQPTPQPTAGPATPTIDTPDGAGEALELNAKPSSEHGSQAPATSAEGEKSAASSPSTAEPRTAGPPAPDTATPDPNRLAPRPPALSNTPSNTPSKASPAEALPDDASADVRLEAAAQARAEQTPATRTDGGGLALRADGDASLQPRPTAPTAASSDAAPASSPSAEGGTADQGSDSDPQQRHRDAQALQQALRLIRQNGPASALTAPAPPSSDFSPSLSEALATLSSDTPTVTTTEDADGEAQLLRHALEGVLSEVKPSRTAPTSRTAAPGASQANMNAWMKTLMNQPARAFALNNGWQVLQVQLEDGQGSLTVSARRDDDSVAVSVGFTDAALRGQAAVHAGRIQDALQTQYQAQVDFSLQDDTQGQSSRDRSNSGRPSQPLGGAAIEPDTSSSAASSSARAALLGANHEWIA